MKTTQNTYSGRLAFITPSGIVLFIVILFWILGGQKSFAQGVGISEVAIPDPHPSSILELRSLLRGFLAPRMTTVQRDGIISPATGLIIYNTTTNKLNIYNGTSWVTLFSGSSGVNSVSGTTDRISISGTSDLNVDIAGNYIGQTSITTLGIIGTGTWNSSTIDIAHGGTGASSKVTAFDALSPMSAQGDIIYGGVGGTGTRLSKGAAGLVLAMNPGGTAPQWQAAGAGDMILAVDQTIASVKTFSFLPVFSTLTQGSIPFAGANGALSQNNANLFWDNSTNRLGIGTASPSATLTVLGDVNINATGSTTGIPRTIGIIPWVDGNAARYTFGDPWNALQNAYGNRMQLTAFWGVDISGNTENAAAIPFIGGAASDASLNVIGTTATAPVLTITSAGSQSGNMQEWRNSGGTVLAAVTPSGAINLNGSTSGIVTIQPQAATGSYNFNLPTSPGTAGQPLLSGGGGVFAMTFGTLGVAAGGTGLTTFGGINTVLYTTAADALNSVPASSAVGQFLQTTASGGVPSWKTTLAVSNGGTGATSFTTHGVLIGQSTSPVSVTSSGTASEVLTSNGVGTDPSFQAPITIPTSIQVFMSNGTWTKPANVSKVWVKVWGGGGAGRTSTGDNSGGGGGGGAYSEGLVVVTLNVTVTVGTGGTTNMAGGLASSFVGATTVSANGGLGASNGTPSIGGAGGTVSGAGTIQIRGGPGGNGIDDDGAGGGTGGGSPFGGAGGSGGVGSNRSNPTVAGRPGTFPGGGGGGGSDDSGQFGVGAGGYVIVYW